MVIPETELRIGVEVITHALTLLSRLSVTDVNKNSYLGLDLLSVYLLVCCLFWFRFNFRDKLKRLGQLSHFPTPELNKNRVGNTKKDVLTQFAALNPLKMQYCKRCWQS